ncbi:hypothetical protein [Acidicapsa acidisoli]|nr:hypothetical protein [Acidicapsa acidisoli]
MTEVDPSKLSPSKVRVEVIWPTLVGSKRTAMTQEEFGAIVNAVWPSEAVVPLPDIPQLLLDVSTAKSVEPEGDAAPLGTILKLWIFIVVEPVLLMVNACTSPVRWLRSEKSNLGFVDVRKMGGEMNSGAKFRVVLLRDRRVTVPQWF